MTEARHRVRLAQAARLAGVHRTTIFRAIQSGRLSVTTTHDGARRVDVAELERVFGTLRSDATQPLRTVAPQHPATSHSDASAADVVVVLRAQIQRLETDLERVRGDLERERSESHQWRERFYELSNKHTLLLTDQRPAAVRSRPGAASPRRTAKAKAPTEPTLSDVAGIVGRWLRGR